MSPGYSESEWNSVLVDAATNPRPNRPTPRRTKRTAGASKAEKELAAIKSSPWWRATSPGRRVAAKAKTMRVRRSDRQSSSADEINITALKDALRRRLDTVIGEFRPGLKQSASAPQALQRCAEIADLDPRDKALLWLMFIATAATFPTERQLQGFQAEVQVAGASTALAQLVRDHLGRSDTWSLSADLVLMTEPVVDTTDTSTQNLHSGIQRVVRQTLPRWAKSHTFTISIWDDECGVLRDVSPAEYARVFSFNPGDDPPTDTPDSIGPRRILVPWNSVLVIPELITTHERALAMSALGTWSGSELSLVIFDLIPLKMPEAFPVWLRAAFVTTMTVLRSSHRVSAISESVATDVEQFTGIFRDIVPSRAAVRSHPLPVVVPATVPIRTPTGPLPFGQDSEGPLIVVVGSLEPRKNQLFVLRAAELLWNSGLKFRLTFIGWGAWKTDGIEAEISKTQSEGRPVQVIRRATDEVLWSAYRQAAFTVYISLAEGYGLPAAESIAVGTPVVLSNIGSMAEIGAGGGALMVNPRDLDEVADAMRTLLTDLDELASLTEQARQHPQSTWDDYADQTWRWLVDGEG